MQRNWRLGCLFLLKSARSNSSLHRLRNHNRQLVYPLARKRPRCRQIRLLSVDRLHGPASCIAEVANNSSLKFTGRYFLIAGPGVEPRYLRGYEPRMVIRSTHPHRKNQRTLLASTRLIGFQFTYTGVEPATSGFPTARSTIERNMLSVFSCSTWTRTRDERINSPLLYQLSYGTIKESSEMSIFWTTSRIAVQ